MRVKHIESPDFLFGKLGGTADYIRPLFAQGTFLLPKNRKEFEHERKFRAD